MDTRGLKQQHAIEEGGEKLFMAANGLPLHKRDMRPKSLTLVYRKYHVCLVHYLHVLHLGALREMLAQRPLSSSTCLGGGAFYALYSSSCTP